MGKETAMIAYTNGTEKKKLAFRGKVGGGGGEEYSKQKVNSKR